MRLSIRHVTHYRYDTPLRYSIQQLRLTPLAGPAQFVLGWQLDAPGKMETAYDAYGNTMHTLVLRRPVREMWLTVSGEIESVPLAEGCLPEAPGRIPLAHFTCSTRLTEPDEAIRALAYSVPRLALPQDLLALAGEIRERVDFQPGITEVTSTAAQALEWGKGVCQDQAHLMLACCRLRGLPSRYVSGYIDPGDNPHAASHAWVDVWLEHFGWITVDVTHASYASGQYCRIATGRDYDTAAPVRGVRLGGGAEVLDVDVEVHAVVQQ